VHVVDDQPDPVPQRAQVRQQPFDDRPPVQIRRRGQGPDERRTGRRAPERVGYRGPEPLRIAILVLDRHLGGMPGQVRLIDPRPQQDRLAAPGWPRHLGDAPGPVQSLEQLTADDHPPGNTNGIADGLLGHAGHLDAPIQRHGPCLNSRERHDKDYSSISYRNHRHQHVPAAADWP
jgi:hypothetical protein